MGNQKVLENISNSELSAMIDEWVKSEKHRAILKRRVIDGVRFEDLAIEFDLSERQIKNIVYKQLDKVLLKIG